MRRQLRRRPQLETLEAMTLLSGPTAAVVATMNHQVQLDGTAKGNYHEVIKNPDTGAVYYFFGSGRGHSAGRVDVTANIHSPGNIANGQSHGMLVLSGPRGSLTLTLTGPPQNGNTPVPDVFSFTITNASGKYRGAHGTGYIDLGLTPKATPTPAARTSAGIVVHGTFTMTFLTVPPPVTTTWTELN